MLDIFKIQNFAHIKLVYVSIHLGLVSFSSIVSCHFLRKKGLCISYYQTVYIFFLSCFGMSSVTFLIGYSFLYRDIIVFLLLKLLLATLLEYLKPHIFFGQLILLISAETSTSSENTIWPSLSKIYTSHFFFLTYLLGLPLSF